MNSEPWRQVFLHFHDYGAAEETGAAHLGPAMTRAETDGLIESWFFIRKNPCWRLRFWPSHDNTASIEQRLNRLRHAGHIVHWVESIYEPETHAFGGAEAMDVAHRLFHADSRNFLAYLADGSQERSDLRRELSVLLCSALLRGAGQDWYEQGDVWARVAEIRTAMGLPCQNHLDSTVRRLMTVDAGSLASFSRWVDAFAEAGQALNDLARNGKLTRGLRSVLAHHVIFHWNRIGLPYTTQRVLAHTAKSVVLGGDKT